MTPSPPQQRTPYQPAAKKPAAPAPPLPGASAAEFRERAEKYMYALGPIVTDAGYQSVEDECSIRMSESFDPLLCKMLSLLRTAVHDNRRLQEVNENRYTMGDTKMKLIVARVVTELFVKLLESVPHDPPAPTSPSEIPCR